VRLSTRALVAPAAVAAFLLSAGVTSAQEADHSHAPPPAAGAFDKAAGEALYKQNCAACHDNSEATRAPAKITLEVMSFETINFALTEGKMKVQGSSLDAKGRANLIGFLTGKAAPNTQEASWIDKAWCAGPRVADLSGPATVTTFGFDRSNTRNLSAKQAGFSKAQAPNLKLAWAMGFPDVSMMRSQAASVGDTLFLPVAENGKLYAINVKNPEKPCLSWVYTTAGNSPLRTSAAYGVLADGKKVVAAAGLDSTVHLLDAATGKALWTKKVGTFNYSTTTGTPVVLKNRLIVPVSQFEIMQGADNRVTCCTNHGYMLSLDPKTGEQQWRYDTMPDAQPIRDRGDGKMLYGPSGAPIWTSPAIDEKRGLIYFGTGESNSPPAHKNTDALIAIRLADGKEAWSMQATENDIYVAGCGPKPKPTQLNCVSNTVYRDVDFGASVILAKLSNGKEILLAGQKSGTVWGVEPATGKVIWRYDIGHGSPLGGVHWGIAYDKDTVFVPISMIGARAADAPPFDPSLKPGMYALDAKTGATKWTYATTADCSGDRKARAPRCAQQFGFSSAPVVVDDVVFQGSLDGRLFGFDAKTGKVLWQYDALKSFDGWNGVQAKGGSLDGPGMMAAKGMLLVHSGYGMFGQIPGNALLAFKPGA
jgi:polyvinyl alcohol dehydrogenase (cytochrome)